ncbi:MAG: hypothetical protein OXG46_11045 [Chloroflexi bacterium]|nr:hypothetical protein [Chloroflexota bacterium]MCY3938044.1 hypothetical protein [Chloroflexota bacterium]
MSKTARPRYRTALILGAGYVVVFVIFAVGRLLLAEGVRMDLPTVGVLVMNLLLVWVAGTVSFLPLIWTLRRFRRSRLIPIVAYIVAFPFSLMGTLVGGLLGPVAVVIYAVAPLALAIGISFAIQFVLDLLRPPSGGGESEPPAPGPRMETTGAKPV